MQRVSDPADQLSWLVSSAGEEEVTGYDLREWPASTWILHAMYENPALQGLGTHDDLHRRRLDAGDIAPLIIGDVNLEEGTTVTGTALGFVVRPGQDWRRVSWMDYLDRSEGRGPDCGYPPGSGWFPGGSWPVSIVPPPEGSLDEESLAALINVLATGSSNGLETECYAYYAPLPAGDFDTPHLWQGPLRSIPELIDDLGGAYPSSATNFWPADRSWFIWSDWDLLGTKVSGSPELVTAVKANSTLETADWNA